jgi:hypothetical protein
MEGEGHRPRWWKLSRVIRMRYRTQMTLPRTVHRRDFVKSAAVAAVAAALPLADAVAADDAAPSRDYLELRAYRLKPGAPATLLDGYLERALIPALNRRGIRAVGVFTQPDAPDGTAVWVLIPHRSLDSLQSVTAALNTDPAVVAAGADYLSAPTKENPAFDRIDSWLHLSFSGLPRLQVPTLAAAKAARVFELRIYESYSELTALKKVAMFNAGEIELMKALKQSPVFYGQALAGRDLPQLTYMLCTPDRAAAAIAEVEAHTAHNYHPLPVVLATGEGAWVTDVDGNALGDQVFADHVGQIAALRIVGMAATEQRGG